MLKGTVRIVTAMALGAAIGWLWSWLPYLNCVSYYRQPVLDAAVARQIGAILGAFVDLIGGLAWIGTAANSDPRGMRPESDV